MILFYICILVVVYCALIFNKEWRSRANSFLLWFFIPFGLLFVARRMGYIKASILSIFSPPAMFVVLIWGLISVIDGHSEGVPASIPYHTAADLRKITGVDFPDVTPVDSAYYEDFNRSEISIKFVPRRPLSKAFYSKLRHACVADPCCWKKEENGYRYYILPEQPIDRPNGTHIRQVEVNGEMENDWQGDFIEVFVPFKGDTIYVKDGWAR